MDKVKKIKPMKQLLMFPEKRNFHILWLGGRPAGSYSLEDFCRLNVDSDNYSYYGMTRAEAVKDHIDHQQALIKAFRAGLCPFRPVWLKQRNHWNKLKKAIQSNEPLEIYYETVR